MRIGEIAQQTGLNVSNIRFYERKGLLSPKRDDSSNYREYLCKKSQITMTNSL